MQEYLDIIDLCNNRFHGRNECQNCRYGNYCQNYATIAILMNTLLYAIEYGVKPLESGSNTCFG